MTEAASTPEARVLGPDAALGRWTDVLVGGRAGFVLEPVAPAPGTARPWVLYAPTFSRVLPDGTTAWLFAALVRRGLTVGGMDVGESYGSPAGRCLYDLYYDHVVARFGLDTVVRLLPQSRGGLMLYPWAAERPERIERIGGIFPVCDLRSFPGVEVAAAAYGLATGELTASLASHNPVDLAESLARAGVPVLHVHGDSDVVVPLEHNSAALQQRYRAWGGTMDLVVVPGQGHEVTPELFEAQDLVDFLAAIAPPRTTRA